MPRMWDASVNLKISLKEPFTKELGALIARYQTFLSYLNEHGLTPHPGPDDAPIIRFPSMPKSDVSQVIPQLFSAVTDLSKAIERESITIETFGGEKVSKAKKFLRKLVEKNLTSQLKIITIT